MELKPRSRWQIENPIVDSAICIWNERERFGQTSPKELTTTISLKGAFFSH